MITDADLTAASRLLQQAGFGGPKSQLDSIARTGLSTWLDSELARPLSSSMAQWLIDNGRNDASVTSNVTGDGGWPSAIWYKLFASPDQVRQRVAFALSEIFVVSSFGLPIQWTNFALAYYWEMLERNAFGNYRTLLEEVTLSSAMGTYLGTKGNLKANTATGRVPDENYAREVMQLLSLGLYQLNVDGSLKLDAAGKPIETYTNTDIQGLARVFTGWAASSATDPTKILANTAYQHSLPMVNNAAQHETGSKVFLGTTIPANTDGATSLKIALDALFNHANTPPFICKQLIQRLVTSNPSPAYVGRVAAVFINNGSGVRGDLKAVIRAVLMDSEARNPGSSPSFGKLREPVVRLVQWGRVFGASSSDAKWTLGYTDPDTVLGQMPLRAPSVFNYFRPGYIPPGTNIDKQGWVAPEFQIANIPTAVGYVNYMLGTVNNARNVKADYSSALALVDDAPALVDMLNMVLCGGTLTSESRTTILTALNSIATTTDAGKNNRVYAAILLVMATTDYLIQR